LLIGADRNYKPHADLIGPALSRATGARAVNRIEGNINAGNAWAVRSQSAYGSDKVTCAIVDRRGSEALDYRQVRRGTGTDRP
jgi:hypothetical protein